MPMPTHDDWMRQALAEADRAFEEGEVPVGAVIVRDGEVIARGHNRRESRQSPLSHAEIEAIASAAARQKSWRLDECDLYVTLEPCLMCAGAAVQARLRRLVFGCRDPKAGAVRSLYRCAEDARLNHRLDVVEGVLADEAAERLRAFFKRLRGGPDADSGADVL
ncbi:MAG: nucleoside deaminase [Myxococcales bacterium]|nr:MAG: nucleoside deaminase [Myxococcales bacterium]